MKKTKVLSLVIVLILVLSMVFTACDTKPVETSGPTQTGDATEKPTETATGEEPGPVEPEELGMPDSVEITHLAYYGDPTENIAKKFAFQEYIENLYGIRFRVHSPARDTYTETINLQAVSGDLTGLVGLFTGFDMITWAQEGLIHSLDDFLKDNETWINIIPEEWKETYTWDGNVWGFPRGEDGEPSWFIRTIRGDWLENLGLSKPDNINDFYEVSKAFTLNDPDKNGANDTWGIASRTTWLMQDIFQAYDARTNHVGGVLPIWHPVKDIWEDSVLKPEFADACTFLRKVYTEGIIHPELWTMGAADVRNLISNGLAGSCFYWDTWMVSWENAVKKQTPTAYMLGIGALSGNATQAINNVAQGQGPPYVLMKNTEQPKEVVNWAVDMLWGSAENHYTSRYGIMQDNKNGTEGFYLDGNTVYLLFYQLNPETETVENTGIPQLTTGHPGYALNVGYYGYERAYNSGDAEWDQTQTVTAASNLQRRYDVLDEYNDGRLYFLPEDLKEPDNEAFQNVSSEWAAAGRKYITDVMIEGVTPEVALKGYLSTVIAFNPQETLDYMNSLLGKTSEQDYNALWSSMN